MHMGSTLFIPTPTTHPQLREEIHKMFLLPSTPLCAAETKTYCKMNSILMILVVGTESKAIVSYLYSYSKYTPKCDVI